MKKLFRRSSIVKPVEADDDEGSVAHEGSVAAADGDDGSSSAIHNGSSSAIHNGSSSAIHNRSSQFSIFSEGIEDAEIIAKEKELQNKWFSKLKTIQLLPLEHLKNPQLVLENVLGDMNEEMGALHFDTSGRRPDENEAFVYAINGLIECSYNFHQAKRNFLYLISRRNEEDVERNFKNFENGSKGGGCRASFQRAMAKKSGDGSRRRRGKSGGRLRRRSRVNEINRVKPPDFFAVIPGGVGGRDRA